MQTPKLEDASIMGEQNPKPPAVSERLMHEHPPARNLTAAYAYCDPFTPLEPGTDDGLREDLSVVRGGDRLAQIRRAIDRAGSLTTLHLLSGHVGSGKTTELLRLCAELEARDGHEPVTVIYLDAERLLELRDIVLEDLLLALWLRVGQASGAALAVLSTWWKERLKSRLVGLSAELPDALLDALQRVLTEVKASNEEVRKTWRAAISPLSGALIEGLNAGLMELRAHKTGPVLIAIDQLEKLDLQQANAVQTLYLDRLTLVRQLQVHVILTVPLFLCYSGAGAGLLKSAFGSDPVVLPMVKVGKRLDEGGGDYADGLNAMVEMLAKRVDFPALFEGGLDTAREIARLSGGCIRHALALTQAATELHDDPKISRESVQRAAGHLIAGYERSLPEAWVEHVVHIARFQAFGATCSPADKCDLLRYLYVLEYQNGEPQPWYDVHPLVLRTRKVQRALQAQA